LGEEGLPGVVEALEFVAVDLTVPILVAVGIVESEGVEDATGGHRGELIEGSFAIVALVEIGLELGGEVLVPKGGESGKAK
jgi:hypothetical protein